MTATSIYCVGLAVRVFANAPCAKLSCTFRPSRTAVTSEKEMLMVYMFTSVRSSLVSDGDKSYLNHQALRSVTVLQIADKVSGL
eukprot:2806744-Pleurochrysis_carterae.AAC.3